MRRSLLAASGIAAALLLVVGGIALLGFLSAERQTVLGWQAAATIAPTPADRYGSRGLLPIEVDDDLGPVEVYLVEPDGALQPPPHGLRQAIWDLMLAVMTPEAAVDTIGSYKVADDPDSDRTAWVAEHPLRDGEWILGVNLATMTDPTQAAATLVHEYAHLVSLRDGQVVAGGDHCITLRLPEGCALPGGYLDAFHHAFWADYGDVAPGPANADPAAALALYRTRPDAFVSEYAAMNVAEDFAESFAAYVHADAPGDEYDGKLAFFGRYQEMVAIRDRIRGDLGDTLGSFDVG